MFSLGSTGVCFVSHQKLFWEFSGRESTTALESCMCHRCPCCCYCCAAEPLPAQDSNLVKPLHRTHRCDGLKSVLSWQSTRPLLADGQERKNLHIDLQLYRKTFAHVNVKKEQFTQSSNSWMLLDLRHLASRNSQAIFMAGLVRITLCDARFSRQILTTQLESESHCKLWVTLFILDDCSFVGSSDCLLSKKMMKMWNFCSLDWIDGVYFLVMVGLGIDVQIRFFF